MLANPDGELEFKLGARARPDHAARTPLRDQPEDSRGGLRHRRARIVADLLDGDLANVHMGTVALGIRHVLCVPLRLVRYLDKADAAERGASASACCISTAARRARCCRLDARRRSRRWRPRPPSRSRTRGSIARRSRRRGIEQEMRIAAEIQQALLPQGAAQRRVLRGGGDVAAVPLDRRRFLRLSSSSPAARSASRSATSRARGRRRRC